MNLKSIKQHMNYRLMRLTTLLSRDYWQRRGNKVSLKRALEYKEYLIRLQDEIKKLDPHYFDLLPQEVQS